VIVGGGFGGLKAARKLARQLSAAGIPAVDLHGNLAQSARDRNLAAFTNGSVFLHHHR